MNIEFEANESGIDADEYSITVGVSNDENVLLFSTESEEYSKKENWGPYLEYNDQINGEYGCIKKCTINDSFLELELSKQLGTLKDVTGFKVALNLNPKSFETLTNGLKQIFKGNVSVLDVRA